MSRRTVCELEQLRRHEGAYCGPRRRRHRTGSRRRGDSCAACGGDAVRSRLPVGACAVRRLRNRSARRRPAGAHARTLQSQRCGAARCDRRPKMGTECARSARACAAQTTFRTRRLRQSPPYHRAPGVTRCVRDQARDPRGCRPDFRARAYGRHLFRPQVTRRRSGGRRVRLYRVRDRADYTGRWAACAGASSADHADRQVQRA